VTDLDMLKRDASTATELCNAVLFIHRGDWDTAKACHRVYTSMRWQDLSEDTARLAQLMRAMAQLALRGEA